MAAEENASRVGAHKHRCPGQAELLLAIDSELAPVDQEAADIALDALAWRLMAPRAGAREQLERVAVLVTRAQAGKELPACAASVADGSTAQGGPLRVSSSGTLRLSEALAGVPAHPLVVACALAEVASRAGLALGVVGCEDLLLVAHRHLRAPLVIDPSAPERGAIQAQLCAGGRELRWRCAHQTASVILDAITEDSQRRGDFGRAIRAAELRLDLPFDDEALERRRDEVARVRARLN